MASPSRATPSLWVVHLFGALGGAALLSGCVTGAQLRASADVVRTDVERARRSGALRCAPRELAAAEANLDFTFGELAQGNARRAGEHMAVAEAAVKRALFLSRDCAPRQVVVKEQPQLVVKIEATDKDGDGVLDKDDACPHVPGPAENKGCPVEAPRDGDGDGLPDSIDRCPENAEDLDGFQDDDGCPDLDNDGDGLADKEDRCPLEAEDRDGFQDDDGCPDGDNDGDGVLDGVDRCVLEPEDRDGFQDEDGCPDLDNDGDGVVDAADKCPAQAGPVTNYGCPVLDKDADGLLDEQDKCPNEPEDKDGFQDDDGCPDLDNDRDGVADVQDDCPNEAGVPEAKGCPKRDADGDGIPDGDDACPEQRGPVESKGCPKKYALVTVTKEKIEIKKQIRFATASYKIVGKDSEAVLRDVAQALKDSPHIKRVRVEGHTDAVGNDEYNLRLSQNRADAVRAALLRLGIDPGRMESVGFGETKPLESNETSAGRAANRRTEFNIVEQ